MPTSPAQPRFKATSGLGGETPPAASLPEGRTASIVALGAIIALAAILRFIDLGAKSLWSDEAFSLFIATLRWQDFWQKISTVEANMSLYYVLLRGWLNFGDAAWWVRLPSALTGVATVPVVYAIGRDTFSRRTGIFAALLLAINLFHVRYSQEARSYSLLVFLVVLSFWSFFRCLKHANRVWSVCYVLSSALALYAHFFAALALVAQLVSLAVIPKAWRSSGTGQLVRTVVVIVLGLPLLWFVVSRNRGQLNWAPPVHWIDLYHFFLFFTGSGLRFGIALLAFVIAGKAWITRSRRRSWDIETWSVLVLILWLFLPVCLTLLVSIWKPVYAPRFLLFCLPAALLLVADGLAEIRYAWMRYVLMLALVVSSIAPIRSFYRETGQEDWKSAVEFLAQNFSPGDTAVLPNSYCESPLKYELQHAGVAIPDFQITSAVPSQSQQSNGTGRLWMITCSASKDANAQSAIQEYEAQEIRQFKGVEIVRLDREQQR
jgi:mannosyltransferase